MTHTRETLPEAIRTAEKDSTINVVSETVKELGERAAKRMDRTDLKFEVSEHS